MAQRRELVTVDARFELRGTPAADPDIVIVDLDDESLGELGGGGAAIPRDRHAELIEAAPAGAGRHRLRHRVPRGRAGDARLRAAIDRDARGGCSPRRSSTTRAMGSSSAPGEESPAAAFAGFPLAPDGAYREDRPVGRPVGRPRSEPESSRLESLPVVASEIAGDARSTSRARGSTSRACRDVPDLPLHRRPGRPGCDRFTDKVVVVGTSARVQGDLHPTRAGDDA